MFEMLRLHHRPKKQKKFVHDGSGISPLARRRPICDLLRMPHRPPRKVKKPAGPADRESRSAQREGQRRHEMATRSTLNRFQNRKSEKK